MRAPGLSRGQARHGRDGFTLIEVLAAFVILALFTIAIQRNVVAAAWTMSRAQDRIGAEAVAATLLDGPLAGENGRPSPSAGTLNGFSWTLRVASLPPDRFGAASAASGEAPAWAPVRVSVTVTNARSLKPLASAEIIRLVPTALP